MKLKRLKARKLVRVTPRLVFASTVLADFRQPCVCACAGSEDMRLDEVTMLLAMGVFILHAPASVVRVPALQYPCVNEFTTCLQSDSVQVRTEDQGWNRKCPFVKLLLLMYVQVHLLCTTCGIYL